MSVLIKEEVSKFLALRGLSLSEEKTKFIPWTLLLEGASVDFLSWTHQLQLPRKGIGINKKNCTSKLIDKIELYTSPSRQATGDLRKKIKEITSKSQVNKPLPHLINELNLVIRDWSNYFSPGPNQKHLRQHLDVYIWRRLRKAVMNKYGHTYSKYFLDLFTFEIQPNSTHTRKFYHKPSKTLRIWKKTPSWVPSSIYEDYRLVGQKAKTINLLKLRNLNTHQLWMFMEPSLELMQSSYLLNPEPYLKLACLTQIDNYSSSHKDLYRLDSLGKIPAFSIK